MTNETEVEVTQADRDAETLALVILNSDRALAGLPPAPSREDIPASDGYVANARAVLDYWNTRASRATDTALAEEVVDSGMSAKAVERAEWLWANLPTGRKWTGLATHEKALVCHTLAVLEGKRT